jgi:hypothetical protein
MNNDKSWQKALDSFLVQNPPNADTRVLARALVEGESDSEVDNTLLTAEFEQALHIERNIDAIGLQPLPASLEQKLQGIGNTASKETVIWVQFKKHWQKISAVAATIATITLFSHINGMTPESQEPSLAEIKKAEQELAIAFHYLSAARTKSAQKVQQTLDQNVRLTINHNLFKQLNYIKESS